MPKLKTHRGAAKRFKKTASGKFKRGQRLQGAHPDQQVAQPQAPAEGHDVVSDQDTDEAAPDASL